MNQKFHLVPGTNPVPPMHPTVILTAEPLVSFETVSNFNIYTNNLSGHSIEVTPFF